MTTPPPADGAGPTPQDDSATTSSEVTRRSAGAFDIRNFIAALIGIYGVICLVLGIASFTDEESRRTGGINANLIAGGCMIMFALIFFAWARIRPVVVPVEQAPVEPASANTENGT